MVEVGEVRVFEESISMASLVIDFLSCSLFAFEAYISLTSLAATSSDISSDFRDSLFELVGYSFT